MRALIVKLSSMGDIIHTLPAITDISRARPDIQFDWVIEESFKAIPSWHPSVKTIIPIKLRQWRKTPINAWQQGAWQTFYKQLRSQHYDYIIDAQGLIKSAVIASLARGNKRLGLDRHSAREPLASVAYTQCFSVSKDQHAIRRTQQLFYAALLDRPSQPLPNNADLHYGISSSQFQTEKTSCPTNTIIFIHGSSRSNKCWPEENWVALAKRANNAGFTVQLLWGNAEEKARAKRIAEQCTSAHLLDTPTLDALAEALSQAKAVVTVDTGPGHLAAALNIPTVGLYGPTNPIRCGMQTPTRTLSTNLRADTDFKQLGTQAVWEGLEEIGIGRVYSNTSPK